MSKVFVVTPTYNEKENLPILVEKIFSLRIPDLRMIVVDDNSPDGTGRIADELGKKYPITVIHRSEKSGLGTAYVIAFKEILAVIASQTKQSYNNADDNFIIQLDADLSHDPQMIPEILRKAQNDQCDIVLGSRYIQGGGTVNWDFFRKLVSRFGNFYARLVLNLPYRDLTGGYKCFRAEILKNIDLDHLSSVGYNFQIETTYRAHKKGFKIAEIPITFTERKTGESKFNLGIMLEAFWRVLLLRSIR